MNYQGSIELNHNNDDALEELFNAVIIELLSDQTNLAIWLMNEIDFSLFNTQKIGAESPFKGSNSVLAGSGLLIKVEPNTINELIQTFSTGYLTSEVLHLEIEVEHSVQFEAYDHFECIFFGNKISLELLNDLKSRGVIDHYEISEKES
ncbi:hypothetical protein M595_3961 [Lyngbya aestuarii BL J]|mgnify:CR=1 FL=1|uniref:Uncharacterized protein n=1 Tax=Lyngbya aestuarii BL J TaxID=1348334 RepID=U7QG72_9CYAN|nr:hypothetical protein [Lyngbya aestuarii]ERT06085.1 hypothetical protein M595_3961 [Lyngbya aestuarii BL J]